MSPHSSDCTAGRWRRRMGVLCQSTDALVVKTMAEIHLRCHSVYGVLFIRRTSQAEKGLPPSTSNDRCRR